MGRARERLDEGVRSFLSRQRVFFVGTAPLSPEGHINVSPKGVPGTFRIVDESTVAYLDLTGSGAETLAHMRENGRIVLMFCAFEGPPRVVRIHGRGEVAFPGDDRFDALSVDFSRVPGARAVVVVRVTRVSDSCGYGVPLMDYVSERSQLPAWAERKGQDGLTAYRRKNNSTSIDGLPASRD